MQVLGATVTEGILLGAIYGLAACGLSLVFGVMGLINLVHGEFIMLGAFTCFWLWFLLGTNPLLATVVAMIAVLALAALIYKVAISRAVSLIAKAPIFGLILTFGFSIFLWNISEFTFSSTIRSVALPMGSIGFLGRQFPISKITCFVIALVVIGLVYAFLKWTRIGKGMRAVTQNINVASMSGVNIDRIKMIGYGIGGGMAGIAGALIATQWAIFPFIGQELIVKCFAITALGGLGSLPGALIGGLILGVAESVGIMYANPIIALLIAPLLVVLCFIFRPQGLFGRKERVD